MLTYLMLGGGPGSLIGGVHKHSLDLLGKARLVGGCFSRSHGKSLARAREWDLDENRIHASHGSLFAAETARPDKPDFVVIATPNNAHYPAARDALDHGFHIACDKPLCITPEEADDLIRRAHAKNLEFLVTYNYTGYTAVRQMRSMIRAGELGSLRLVAAEYLQGWLSEPAESENKQAAWRVDPAQSGAAGCAADIGTHAENLVHFVTGLEMTRLSARLDSFVPGRALDDNGFVLCEFASGAKGSIWTSQVAAGGGNGLSLRVFGTGGSLEWRQENPGVLVFSPKNEPARLLTRGGLGTKPGARHTNLPSGNPEGKFEAFANLYDGFISSVRARREGRDPAESDAYPDVRDGARGVRFIHACVASSAKDGAWIPVNL